MAPTSALAEAFISRVTPGLGHVSVLKDIAERLCPWVAMPPSMIIRRSIDSIFE
jgi:hypothetical protein